MKSVSFINGYYYSKFEVYQDFKGGAQVRLKSKLMN